MAKITFSLSTKANKDNGLCEVLIRFRNGREVSKRVHSRVWVAPKFFDSEVGDIVIKSRKLTQEVKDAFIQKGQLEKIKDHLIVTAQSVHIDETKGDWAQRTVDYFLFPEKQEIDEKNLHKPFFELYDRYLESNSFSAGRLRHYNVLKRALQRWELYRRVSLDIYTMTAEDLKEFKKFFQGEYRFFKTDENGKRTPLPKYSYLYEFVEEGRYPVERGENYVNSVFKMLRAFFTWCNGQSITENDPFRRFSVGSQVYGTPIYISIEERDKIANADMGGNKHLETQRDIFIFQCFVGCRVSDLYSFTKGNIIPDKRGVYIEYVPHKTKDENPNAVKVYLTDVALNILHKYEDCDSQKLFPFITQQRYNDAIKDVFRKAGIDRMVTVRNSVTGKNELKCIADVASSHMARRTFVGNLYKQVKDPNLVGKLSGHKEGSNAFSRYRDIDDDMVREMTDLLGGNQKNLTQKQKSAIINRKVTSKEEWINRQKEIQQLLSTGALTMQEYAELQNFE